MSAAIDLLREAQSKGIVLEVEGADLYVSGPVDEDIIGRLRAAKPDLLAHLTAQRHGLTIADLREAAGPDWPEVERDPALLETLAHAVSVRRMRELGIVPAHYTASTICARCGSVPIFEGAPERVLGCAWCFNRTAGKPVPKAKA